MTPIAAIICLVGFVAAVATGEESAADDFEQRYNVVDQIWKQYERFLRLNKGGEPDAASEALQKFNSMFEEDFDDSDEWLLDALTTKNGFVKELVERTKYHYTEIKQFLEKSSQMVQTAAKAHYQYLLHRNNVTEASDVQLFMDRARREMTSVTKLTLEFIRTTAWKKQFPQDVAQMAASHRNAPDLLKRLVTHLHAKFPFRVWLAVLTPVSVESSYCFRNRLLMTHNTLVANHVLTVLQTDAMGPAKVAAAARALLGKVSDNKKTWFSCKERAKKIVEEEAEYKCPAAGDGEKAHGKFALVAAVKEAGDLPKMECSVSERLHTKRVYRGTRFGACKSYYQVMVFA